MADVLGNMGGPLSYFLNSAPSLDRAHLDGVVINLSYIDLINEITAFQRFRTEDDAVIGGPDAEYALQAPDVKAHSFGPLTRELVDYLKKAPAPVSDFLGNVKGEMVVKREYGFEMLRDAEFRSLVLRQAEKLFTKVSALARQHGLKVWVDLYPFRNFLGPGEMDGGGRFLTEEAFPALLNQPLREAAGRQDLGFIDLFPEARLMDPVLFPLCTNGDHHYNPAGHQWLGFLLARKLLAQD